MAVFAIGDLHLPGHLDKPMDVFGQQWDRHFDSIERNWRSAVSPGDIVLVPGDLSWAMQMDKAMDDLRAIAALPGLKLILRGNHDYWWSSISKLRAALPESMKAIQNDAVYTPEAVVCGTRSWSLPMEGDEAYDSDMKLYQREIIRLRLSLEAGARLSRETGKPLIAMTHFPPLYSDCKPTGFSELIEEYRVPIAVYGHLHGAGIKNAFIGEHGGTKYSLVSCDAIDFCPIRVL